ncbi:MAG TPA: sodium-translocating pyrophosphatase [Patescibacteria group bacterium]|nr:sodium-translocating pyrophosphatase [Patescibacteria group bacterium]
MLYIPIIISVIGILIAVFLSHSIKKQKIIGLEQKRIADLIKQGAGTFLKYEYRVLMPLILLLAGLLFFFISWQLALTFIFGSIFSCLAGSLGMNISTSANVRTVEKVKISILGGLKVAFKSGLVMGVLVSSLGILGIGVFYIIFKDPEIIYGFGFGASLVALFFRVGGGIYTKAADIGADLVGKVNLSIPEDDPRNPAVLADNVGDNVGDVAGMGSDLFESYVDSIIATMVLGVSLTYMFGNLVVLLPLLLACVGLVASLFGSLSIYIFKENDPQKILNIGIWLAGLMVIIGSFLLFYFISDKPLILFGSGVIGLVAGTLIGFFTEYFTSSKYSHTKNLSQSSKSGAGTNIIAGMGLGMSSTTFPAIIIGASLFGCFSLAGLYGVGIGAVGMLSTLALTLASDTYGPVADNAAGIAEMTNMGKNVRQRAEKLDTVGNTTAAIGKGFAVGSAALTALILSISFSKIAGINVLNLNEPNVVIGVLMGGLMPFIFSSLVMKAVSQSASKIVEEVERQFREIKGLKEGNAKPDYNHCIKISTKSSLRKMILPGILTIVIPVLMGFLIGKQALGGFLIGSVVVGFLLAVMMANSGGAWDNAKKYIEAGNLGGKNSNAHKASIIGDTVGDSFKDSAGPALNILIKIMAIIALIIAPLL